MKLLEIGQNNDKEALAEYIVQFVLIPPKGWTIDSNFIQKLRIIIEWDIMNLK